jgi:hypothetical protein
MEKDWHKVYESLNIPDYTKDPTTQSFLSGLERTAQRGYGAGYVYDQLWGQSQAMSAKTFGNIRTREHALESKFGGAMTLGATGRLRAESLAALGAEQATLTGASEARNEQAADMAKKALLAFFGEKQSQIAQVMSSYYSMQTSKDIAQAQLEAQESGCALVAERYGATSIEEKLMKIWEKMHIRMNRGKRVRRQLWRALFIGYHEAAPWVVFHTKRRKLISRIKTFIVDRFVAYILCDVMRHRKPTLGERMSAYVVLVLSLIGWGFKKWQ